MRSVPEAAESSPPAAPGRAAAGRSAARSRGSWYRLPVDRPDPAVTARWAPSRAWLIVAGAAAVLLILSIYQINARAFWYDEAVSVTLVRLPFDELLRIVAGDEANGALYYLLLAGWRLLGDGEARVRALSVLCVVATIPLLYLIGRRHVGVAGAVAGCVLFAVNPFVIEYAQEARMYALAMLVVSAAILAWSFATETDRRRWWAAYAILAAASLYTHFFAGFVVVGLGMTWLAGLVPRTRRSVLAQAAVVLAGVPIAVFMAGSGVSHVTWVEPFSEATVSRVLGGVGGGLAPLAVLLDLAAVAGIATRDTARIRRIAPLAASWLAPLVIGIAISLWASLLVPRYFIVSVPPLMLLAGAGVVRVGGFVGGERLGMPIATAIIVVAVLLGAGPLADRYGQPRTAWRDAATWVSRNARPGDRIVYDVERAHIPFGLYLKRTGGTPPTDASLDDLRASTGRSWLVLYTLGKRQEDDLHASLPGYRVVESKLFEDVRVQLVERP